MLTFVVSQEASLYEFLQLHFHPPLDSRHYMKNVLDHVEVLSLTFREIPLLVPFGHSYELRHGIVARFHVWGRALLSLVLDSVLDVTHAVDGQRGDAQDRGQHTKYHSHDAFGGKASVGNDPGLQRGARQVQKVLGVASGIARIRDSPGPTDSIVVVWHRELLLDLLGRLHEHGREALSHMPVDVAVENPDTGIVRHEPEHDASFRWKEKGISAGWGGGESSMVVRVVRDGLGQSLVAVEILIRGCSTNQLEIVAV